MNKIAEQARLRASLEELARFGCPVDLSVADPRVGNEKVEIDQVGDIFESQILELQDGRARYMANIAVTNQTARTIDLINVELRAPWDNSNNTMLQWLQPIQVNFHRAKPSHWVYQLPDEGTIFSYDEVINHHLIERRKLPAKCCLEGLLLAIGGVMPAQLHQGERVDVSLTIVAADHDEYSAPITLWTERLSAAPKKLKPRTRISAELVGEAVYAGDANGTARPPASPPPDVVQNLGSVGTAQEHRTKE